MDTKVGNVDTKTLVVGQEVYMFCGSEFYGFAKGKVVKITSAGVEVLVGESIIRLDNNGTELEVERRKRHGFEPEPGFSHDRFMQSIWYTAPECGPWRLDDMPFEERRAKIEHHQRLMKIIKTLVVGQEVWMVSGPYIKGDIGGGHDLSAHHHRIDAEPLTLVHDERQRADKGPFGQGDLSARNNQRMLWREL